MEYIRSEVLALAASRCGMPTDTKAAHASARRREEALARNSPWALLLLSLLLGVPSLEATIVRSIPIEGSGSTPDDSGYVVGLKEVSGRLVFDGSTGAAGHEPWAFNPETDDAALLVDLCPGPCGDLRFLARVAGLAYYSVANDPGGYYRGLMRTDGTPEGTRLLLRGDGQGRLARFGGSGEQAVAAGSSLVFLGEDDIHGRQLWVTDGTEAGTKRVSPFPGSDLTSQVYEIGATDGYAAAVVYAPEDNGYQLWTYRLGDGVEARVPDAPEHPYRFTSLGDRIIFLGYGVGQDEELWGLEGPSSTATRLTDFAAPNPFEQTGWFEVHGGIAYFLCNDIEHGEELWRSDGRPGGTRAVSGFGYYHPFEHGGGAETVEISGNAIYFIATDGLSQLSLWESTGAGGQTRVLELCENYCGVFDRLWVVRAGARLYFPRQTAEQGLELWTIGPDGQATLTADRCAGACSADMSAPIVIAGSLFLWIATSADGVELFSFDDGAPAGIRRSAFENDYPWEIFPLVDDAPDVDAAAGRWFFRAAGDGLNSAIWEVASGAGPMHAVARVGGWAYGSQITQLAGYSGGVLFARYTGEAIEVDRVPPSTDATEPVAQLAAGCSTSPFAAVESDAVALRLCSDQPSTLMRIDSAGGFEEISLAALGAGAQFQTVLSTGERAVVPYLLDGRWHLAGLAPSASSPIQLASFSPDLIWWSASEPVLGAILIAFNNSHSGDDEIWATDGTLAGTRRLLAQPNLIGYDRLAAWDMGGFALFCTMGGDSGRILWRTDGTAVGTTAHWTSPQYGENIRLAGRLGPQLLFFTLAYNRTSLYSTQGRPGDVVPVLQEEGESPLVLAILPVSDSAGLYFVVDRPETGREVAVTDGSVPGTRVLDLTPGPGGSAVRALVSSGDAVFAIASTAEYGTEIFRVNAARSGLTLHADLAPGAQPSLPAQLLISGEFLFSTANDGLTGDGLWRVSASPADRECPSDPAHLCLGEGQFELVAHWRDFWGGIGAATAVDLTGDTGWFWFFDPANVETMVKVLDGRPVNSHHWVFYGALSNVEYWITARNAENGTSRRYHNVAGRYASRGDVNAFGPLATEVEPDQAEDSSASAPLLTTASLADASGTCTPSETRLCLQQGRFAVEATWRDFEGNTGIGTAVPLSADTGYFWFFWDANVEVILKVLDGRPVNDKFWVYYGALSNVEYTLTVTDTETGAIKTYFNPSGRFASVGDNFAF